MAQIEIIRIRNATYDVKDRNTGKTEIVTSVDGHYSCTCQQRGCSHAALVRRTEARMNAPRPVEKTRANALLAGMGDEQGFSIFKS